MNSTRTIYLSACSFFSITLLAILAFSSLPSYTTNDDVLLQFIVSGFFGSGTETFTLYTHSYWSGFLAWLYKVDGSIAWYPITYQTIQLLATTALFFTLTRRQYSLMTNAFILITISLAAVPFLLYFHYTSVAFLAASTGAVCIISHKRLYTIGLIFLSLAILIRPETYTATLLFSVPVLIYCIVTLREWRPITIFGVSLALFLIAGLLNKSHYETNGYPDALAYKSVHWKLYDAHFSDANYTEGLQKAGWDTAHLQMMRANTHYDTDIFTTKKTIALLEKITPTRPVSEWPNAILPLISNHKRVLAFFVIGLFFILQISRPNFKLKIGYAIYLAGIVMGLLWLKKVTLPILMGMALFYLLIHCLHVINVSKTRLAILLTLAALQTGYVITHLPPKTDTVSKKIESLAEDNNHLYVVGNAPLAYELSSIPFYTPISSTTHNIIFTGWLTNTPTFIQWQKNHDIPNLEKERTGTRVEFYGGSTADE